MTLDELYTQFRSLLKEHFPDLFFRHTGYGGLDFHADLASENKMFINTPYYYKGELTFIHWTSIDNLLSIINNREIRLYNLHSSKDEGEFHYAAQELGIEKEQADFAKRYYYTFSFCEKGDLSNKYLWENYGNNSSGVAIEFSIDNNPSDWDKFMISNVHYNVPDNFRDFAKAISELKSKYGVTTSGFNIGKLIGFHKKIDFCDEKEVRIATYYPYRNFEEYLKFAKTEFRIDKITKRNRITNYISLPLWVDNNAYGLKSDKPELDRTSPFDDEYFSIRPKIVLKNIYFGENCGIDNMDLSSFTRQLSDMVRFNLGYKISLELNVFRT